MQCTTYFVPCTLLTQQCNALYLCFHLYTFVCIFMYCTCTQLPTAGILSRPWTAQQCLCPPFGGWVAAPPYLITNKPTQFIWLAGIPAKKKRPRTLINNNKQCNRFTKSATNVCPPATNSLTIMESVSEWVGGLVCEQKYKKYNFL